MPRMCSVCKRAENPIGRLRFKKSRLDGQVYCENCTPITHSLDIPQEGPDVVPVPPPVGLKASAGYVVIDCPGCAGGSHRPHQKPCGDCSGYGAVRISVNLLNVYRPKKIKAPEILTEN